MACGNWISMGFHSDGLTEMGDIKALEANRSLTRENNLALPVRLRDVGTCQALRVVEAYEAGHSPSDLDI